MGLEQKVNNSLQKHPLLKKKIKSFYQHSMVALSKGPKSMGDIKKISPNDNQHDYFFGYYDKTPWDQSGRYVLCLKVKDASKSVAPLTEAEILLIDTQNDNSADCIATTKTWNVQQGCMLQWLGPDFDKEIIYNDFRNNQYCSVILNVFTKEERVISQPVYSVSNNGKFALTLDFSRLHSLRPGYGYANLEEKTKDQNVPEGACIWYVDLGKNEAKSLISYQDIIDFCHRDDMDGAKHKVNHIMLNPANNRFMFMHRWYIGNKKISRLITCDVDGQNLYNLSDDNMVSHCFWKNDEEILGFENKKGTGNGYYLMKDKTNNYKRMWDYLSSDGHPSYSPDNHLVVTDSYPNRSRMSTLRILSDHYSMIIGRVFAPFKYDNDTRCDLHPRWSRDSKKICFDSAHEGRRGLYEISVDKLNFGFEKELGTKIPQTKKKKIKVVFLMTTCRKCGPTQVVFNIIRNLDFSIFDPILITLYEEPTDSNISEIYPYVSQHILVKTGKSSVLLGKTQKLQRVLKEIQPNVIHSTGVFPDYAVSKMNLCNQVMTLHNYVYDAYLSQFGKKKGRLLAKMQLKSSKKAAKTVACSASLSNIYKEKLGLNYDFIRNGIDISKFSVEENKKDVRRQLSLPTDKFIFVYTGQFIPLKNIRFLIENFVKQYKNNENVYLLLLGDGVEWNELHDIFGSIKNVDFRGRVANVDTYLKACDSYISASTSEGLPNGVLEAMATGLPVILSNILPHQEILFAASKKSGFIFDIHSSEDFIVQMENMLKSDAKELGMNARKNIEEHFSDIVMSKQYQKVYKEISK